MGGSIEVQSKMGEGSTFSFTVLLERCADQPRHQFGDGAEGQRVLIVEDNATGRAILGDLCRCWGMEVTAVSDSATALSELRQAAARGEPYRLALLDAGTPEPDGIALAAQLKN